MNNSNFSLVLQMTDQINNNIDLYGLINEIDFFGGIEYDYDDFDNDKLKNNIRVEPVECRFNLLLQRKIIEYMWHDKSLLLPYRLKLGLVCRAWFESVSALFSKNSYFAVTRANSSVNSSLTSYLPHLANAYCPMKYVSSIVKTSYYIPDSIDQISGIHQDNKIDYFKLGPIYSTVQNLELDFNSSPPLVNVQQTVSNFMKFSNTTDPKTKQTVERASLRSLKISYLGYQQSQGYHTNTKATNVIETVLVVLSPVLKDLESLTIHTRFCKFESNGLIKFFDNHPNLTSLTLNIDCNLPFNKAVLSHLPKNLKHLATNLTVELEQLASHEKLESVTITRANLLNQSHFEKIPNGMTQVMRTNSNIKTITLPSGLPVDIETIDIFSGSSHLNEFYIEITDPKPIPSPTPNPLTLKFHSNLKKLQIDCQLTSPLKPELMDIGLTSNALVNLEKLVIGKEYWHIFDLVVAFVRTSKSLRHLELNEPAPRQSKNKVNYNDLLSAITENNDNQLSFMKIDHFVSRSNEHELIKFLTHTNTRYLCRMQCHHLNITEKDTISSLNQINQKLNLSFSVAGIFQYVEVDIDKISLLLTCKRIFGNRAKIEFRLLGCLLNLEQMDEHCRLESFKSSIIRSLKYKLSVKQFEKERSDAYTRKLELFDSLIGLDSTTSTNTTNVAFKPPLEVSDLLALSSDPAFQSSPSAARNYQKSFRALRDLKKRVNDLEGGNSSSNRSNESSQFSKILELDDAINPKSTSFVVDDESFSRVPPGTTHLTFNSKFERFISPSSIPATLTHLTFGHQIRYLDNNNVFVLNQQFMGGFISNTENFNFVDIAKSLESRYQQQSK
ncbi:hypothetical protein PPL_02766 [Heterostelium album PN500]|uniref:Uncharacterized protein n=1 Tax=Heterostelium pallidum (strain ATCC 26659 / Pp 5 / PN500) TaxID=670386 RepID=D3B301_HETP5|nr:hypothetical protein PPL_02766 [Heterostelium album PN500]EFA83699.1 hypothetical protein PPL_02766 [Heterostelium album PN500]|eukprot:XP_020435816.1 hypothetical protein PPL_02766 [Heterostelium album PN500]